MAWKIGLIDHRQSEITRRIVYTAKLAYSTYPKAPIRDPGLFYEHTVSGREHDYDNGKDKPKPPVSV